IGKRISSTSLPLSYWRSQELINEMHNSLCLYLAFLLQCEISFFDNNCKTGLGRLLETISVAYVL
ncbi:MAG: hypothetical protein ACRD4W_14470, partial [Nitrososphaeraceae archaeon]